MRKIAYSGYALIALLIVAYGALLLTRGGDLEGICHLRGALYPFNRINGTVTVSGNQEWNFSARGDYGSFHFENQFDGKAIAVDLFNRANWHIIDLNFFVDLVDDDRVKVHGRIAVDGYDPVEYERSFEPAENVIIKVDCFP